MPSATGISDTSASVGNPVSCVTSDSLDAIENAPCCRWWQVRIVLLNSSKQVQVSNVGFVDNDVDALEIAGSVTWTPPSDTSQVTGYRTYLCSGSLCSTRAQLGSHVSFSTVTIAQSQTHIGVYAKLQTQSSLEEQSTPATIVLVDEQISAVSKFIKLADLSGVSNTEYDIPLDTETNGSTHLLVCLVSAGVEQSSCDPYLFYDVTESVSDVAFTGQDLDLNELGGIITWSPPAWVVYTQRYLVYLAEDAVGTARSQVETAVPVGTNELQLSANTPRLNFTHFLVYTETSWQEQSTPASLAFQDAVAVATNVVFADSDLDRYEIGGVVTWTPPTDTSQLQGYYVYLAEDATGTGRSLVGQANSASSQLTVPDGTALGSFSYLLVYTASALAEASTPKAVAFTARQPVL
ncbi:unnamed protein product [Durusdinium trenchii]|uniref:Uncharacterized protein n=1 Tax=Durusdinium trenchii TaxID=1381693 RepID=A0ABP0SRP9_9DINO